MQLRNVKTANFTESKKAKPIFKKLSSRNTTKVSRSPISTNNISEIDQKETINFQNFQNSMMTLDISFNETSPNQEEYDNYALYKKYIQSKTEYNKMISEIAFIDNKYIQNINTIEKLEKNLSKLKEEKKEKNIILIDLLSNKESLEEIYKIKLGSLINNTEIFVTKKINGQIKENINDTNNPFATIKILEEDENLEIQLDEIKLSDKKKFIEQVINFTEDILRKKETETRNRLTQKINIGYQRFFSEIKSSTFLEPKKIISNFFSKISIFIANQNKGKYPEPLINTFLREILKINTINEKISETLKFINKKYKEKKKEIKEKISNLINRNENLKTKKLTYENKKNEYKKFMDENKDKVKGPEKNKINLENANKQCMSFILDNHFQEELGFLNETNNNNNKKDELNLIEEKETIKNDSINSNTKDTKENNELIEKNNNDKVNKVKVLKVKNLQNKWNEKCNGINNINVNNLLINNNINIENNNNIINNKDNSLDKKIVDNNNKENNININNISKINTEGNSNNNSNKKKIIVIKDMKCIPLKQIKLTPQKTNIFHSPIKPNKTNSNKILFPINSPHFFNKSKSPSRTKTLNYNDINKTFNNQNTYNPKFKLLTQEIPETFCYFKLSDKSNTKFNPLSSNDVSPINFNYFEGTILIDKIFNKLKLVQKSDQKYIGIDLKDIVGINLTEEMDKILKIYKIYLKNGKNQQNFDINKFVSTDNEVIGIRMPQNEKIKAVECKFFIFTIILGKRFVPKAEFIFNNYEHFNKWYNCLQSIVKLNNPDKDKNNK